jgi:hypothetical protein
VRPTRSLGTAVLAVLLASGLLGCAASTPSTSGSTSPPHQAPADTHADYLDLSPSALGRAGPPEGDCDENGIPDSLDIANHYADDNNHNQEIDTCELDYVPGGYDNRTSAWASIAAKADTLTLFRTFAKRVGIVMECYVPEQSGAARLLVRDAAGKEVAVITDCLAPGAHRAFWPLRDHNGLLVANKTEYLVCLEQGARSTQRLVRWNRDFRF